MSGANLVGDPSLNCTFWVAVVDPEELDGDAVAWHVVLVVMKGWADSFQKNKLGSV